MKKHPTYLLAAALGALMLATPVGAVSFGPIPLTAAGIASALGYTPVNKAGDTMTGALNVNQAAQAGTAEVPLKATVSDDAVGLLQFDNASASDTLFLPRINATASGSQTPLTFGANIITDSGTNPTFNFNSRFNAGGAVATRPIFQVSNNAVNKFSIAADGTATAFKMVSSSTSTLAGILTSAGLTISGGNLRYSSIQNITTTPGTMTITSVTTIVNQSVAGAWTLNLVAAPTTGDVYTVIAGKGDEATNNGTISGNGKTINGAASITINKAYAAVTFFYDGTQYRIVNAFNYP